jgi:hypothetical protein
MTACGSVVTITAGGSTAAGRAASPAVAAVGFGAGDAQETQKATRSVNPILIFPSERQRKLNSRNDRRAAGTNGGPR